MKIARLVHSPGIGETLATALDADGAPMALHCDLVSDQDRPRLGDVRQARLRTQAADQGGAFLEDVVTGGPLFLAGAPPPGISEGAALTVAVVAEARSDKAARVRLAREGEATAATPLARWQAALPAPGPDLPLETGPEADALCQLALGRALDPEPTLPGGGRIRLARTPALTAIDIDTAGRRDRGRASARAHALNTVAVAEAARSLALAQLGGLIVIDCVGPVRAPDRPALKQAFRAALRAVTTRRADVLAPSPLGLIEAALAWGETPLWDRRTGAAASLADGLAALERAARAEPGASLRLHLPEAAHALYLDRAAVYRSGLKARYGGRLDVVAGQGATPEVART